MCNTSLRQKERTKKEGNSDNGVNEGDDPLLLLQVHLQVHLHVRGKQILHFGGQSVPHLLLGETVQEPWTLLDWEFLHK